MSSNQLDNMSDTRGLEVMSHAITTDDEQLFLPSQAKTNFYFSFTFLPKEERKAIHTVYAFCRKIDDIVDENPVFDADVIAKKRERLRRWKIEIERIYEDTKNVHSLILPLATVIQRFKIPKQYFLTLIDGCERDLLQRRYTTHNELREYCYSVASIVGLISIEIFGYKYEETREYAINLGYALQMTNIIRDVKADKLRGFIYLPSKDMAMFHYTEEDLLNEVYDERFIALMQHQTQLAREYFNKARSALRSDERMTMFAAQIMDAIYYRLLEKIELDDFRVFDKNFRVSALHKIWIAIKLWVYTRIMVRRLRD